MELRLKRSPGPFFNAYAPGPRWLMRFALPSRPHAPRKFLNESALFWHCFSPLMTLLLTYRFYVRDLLSSLVLSRVFVAQGWGR